MRRFTQSASFTCILAAAGACAYLAPSGDPWQPPRVVTIECEKEIASLLPAWPSWYSDAQDGKSQALLLRDGDLLIGEDFPAVRYLASDGPALKLSFEEGIVRLGETTVTVSVDEENGRKWLESASDRQLAGVRSVGFKFEDPAPGTLAALQRLAAVNPHADLFFESDTALASVLPLFRPRVVVLGRRSHAESNRLLANQPQIEMLLIDASEPGSLDCLGSLPSLRCLILEKWDVEWAGPLPAGLAGLRTLVVADSSTFKDLSPLRAAPAGLEELSLLLMKYPTDLAGLDRMAGLRTLMLCGNDKPVDLSALAALPRLRRVGLPSATTQEQFVAFAGAHPDLAILEMDAEGVTDLAPLQSLKNLQGLVLGGSGKSLQGLKGLTSLRFVGIARETWDAMPPEQIAELRKALPDAVIVRVKPFCLGSGWILLLVPVLAAAWFLGRQPRPTGLAA